MNSYKELKFWQSARETCLMIASLVKKLPNERVFWIISDHVLRSCLSIGANIAEGYGKYKGKEYARFLLMALGSANETEYWIELIKDLYPNIMPEVDKILAKNTETIRMLTASVNTLHRK